MLELSNDLDRPPESVHSGSTADADISTSLEVAEGVEAIPGGDTLQPENAADAAFGEDASGDDELSNRGATQFELSEVDAVRAAVEIARGMVDGPSTDGDTAGAKADDATKEVKVSVDGHDEEVDQEGGHQPPDDVDPPNHGGGDRGDQGSEGGEGRRLYTPHEIARHVATDRVVLSGISPEVGKQNQELVERFRQKAAEMGDDIIAVQFIGSRANGTSALDSDLDVAVVTFGDIHREEARQPFYDTAEAMQVTADLDLAARAAAGIPDEVPEDPDEFLQWVEHGVEGRDSAPISLFDDGIYRTDDQILLRLAVTEVIGAYTYETQRAHNWQNVRDQHAAEYLGNLERMREKLAERLTGASEDDVRRALSQQMMRERREKFGLPADMGQYQQRLARWAARNDARLQPRRGYQLLHAVRDAIA